MISIIIASVNSDFLVNISQDIKNTVGVEFEIISFQNSNGERSLCELYNLGAEKAKYNILCFMHEDVAFLTQDWGKKVESIFANQPKAGVLGIVGSKYKTISPSGWHAAGLNAERGNIVQQFKFQKKADHHHTLNPDGVKLEQVATVDGVWFCTTSAIMKQFQFDENILKKFHGYDIDFCLQVGAKYDILVTYDVLLKHFSEGNFNEDWIVETLKVHAKWKSTLPISRGNFSNSALRRAERASFKVFVKKIKQHKLSVLETFPVLWDIKMISKMGFLSFVRLNFFILRKMIS